jgi:hypothetical protein
MAFSINSFRASFLSGEPAKTSYYEVQFSAPSPVWNEAFSNESVGILDGIYRDVRRRTSGFIEGLGDLFGKDDTEELENSGADPENYRRMTLRCDQAELPGKQLATVEHKHYGPMKTTAYGSTYTPFECSFVCSEDMIERYFFDTWLKYIKNDDPQTEGGGVKYASSYVKDIIISQYDREGDIRYQIKLRDAYPINIASQPVGWDNKNEIHRVSITFAYTDWKSSTLNPISSDPVEGAIDTARRIIF